MAPRASRLSDEELVRVLELALNESGLVVRARRIQGRSGDTVVKLRPVEPDQLPHELRRSQSVTVEVDAMPGGYVCSASLKGRADGDEIRAVTLGEARPRTFFTKEEQRQFLAAHALDGRQETETKTALTHVSKQFHTTR